MARVFFEVIDVVYECFAGSAEPEVTLPDDDVTLLRPLNAYRSLYSSRLTCTMGVVLAVIDVDWGTSEAERRDGDDDGTAAGGGSDDSGDSDDDRVTRIPFCRSAETTEPRGVGLLPGREIDEVTGNFKGLHFKFLTR